MVIMLTLRNVEAGIRHCLVPTSTIQQAKRFNISTSEAIQRLNKSTIQPCLQEL